MPLQKTSFLQRVSRLTRLGAMCIANGAELVMPLCVFSLLLLLLLLLLVLLLLVHRRKRNTSSLDRERPSARCLVRFVGLVFLFA